MTDTVTAHIEAYACSEYGDGPLFATVALTTELIERLRKLRTLIIDNKLSEARVMDGPNTWGPGNIEGELRLTCAELVVTENSFWFVDQPKHASYQIETRAIDFESFETALASGDAVLYFGDDIDELEELIKDETAAAA